MTAYLHSKPNNNMLRLPRYFVYYSVRCCSRTLCVAPLIEYDMFRIASHYSHSHPFIIYLWYALRSKIRGKHPDIHFKYATVLPSNISPVMLGGVLCCVSAACAVIKAHLGLYCSIHFSLLKILAGTTYAATPRPYIIIYKWCNELNGAAPWKYRTRTFDSFMTTII